MPLRWTKTHHFYAMAVNERRRALMYKHAKAAEEALMKVAAADAAYKRHSDSPHQRQKNLKEKNKFLKKAKQGIVEWFKAQHVRAPGTNDVEAMAAGKTALPWSASGEQLEKAEMKTLAVAFQERYHEWERAQEEQQIVKREVMDACAYYSRSLALVGEAFEKLPANPSPFTANEGHHFFLRHRAPAIADVHHRMLKIAGSIGIRDGCVPVDNALLHRVCATDTTAEHENTATLEKEAEEESGGESEPSDESDSDEDADG